MNLAHHREADRLILSLQGRLDHDTAPTLTQVVDHQLDGVTELVLDFDGLEHVSSLGLRVLLAAQKRMHAIHGSLVVRNVNPAIATVFEITGFDRILEYERKPRRLSIDGLELIAKGGNGECFRVDDETVLKLYFDHIDDASASREKRLAKKAFVAGVPTAISYEVVVCGTRRGVLYEMINADTLSKYIERHVERLEAVVDHYVGFCRQIHSIVPDQGAFPDAIDIACGHVEACDLFNAGQRSAILDRLHRVERRSTLIHWDLHPGNIMMQGDVPCLIDMGDMATGTPYFDLGPIRQILQFHSETGLCQKIIGLDNGIARRVWPLFVARYFNNPPPDELAAIEENIRFFQAIRNVLLYRCGTGGDSMRARRREMILQLLPKEITQAPA